MASFTVQYLSDSMLKYLDKTFQELQYDSYENVTCAPGSEITKVPELSRRCTQKCDLLVINTGINNILNHFSVSNCLYLYEQVHKELSQLHPTSEFAFTSVSYIADDKFSGNDRSWEVNPLVKELNESLRMYCSNHDNAHYIDLRTHLGTDEAIERDNLSADGLHYSQKGIRLVAKALICEVDERFSAKLSATDIKNAFCCENVNTESWPALPVPAVKNRIHPAAFPGEQLKQVIVTNRVPLEQSPKKSTHHPGTISEKKSVGKHTQQHCTEKRVFNENESRKLNAKRHVKRTLLKLRKTMTSSKASDIFTIETRNTYAMLDVETNSGQTTPQQPMQLPVFAVKNNMKRKPVKLLRKKKYTKLECAARGAYSHTVETVHPRRNSDYTNPHRTSDFETLRWTKGGFVQTVFDERSCYMIGSSVCYTFGRHKHTMKVVRQSSAHMFMLLLLCGDIESNPGPRMKKQSAKTKRRNDKMSRLQETDDEKRARLDKCKEIMKECRNRQPSEQKTNSLKIDAQKRELSRKNETPKKRQERLKTAASQMTKSRSGETPEKRKTRLQSDANLKSKLRSEEIPEKRVKRLKTVAEQMSKSRFEETPAKRKTRLQSDANLKSKSRFEETPEKRVKRLKTVAEQMSKSRFEETPENRKTRLQNDVNLKTKSRSQETPQEQRERLKLSAGRMANLRRNRQNEIVPLHEIVSVFLNRVKRAADYICCCCNRLMYECGVVIFNEHKYQIDFIDQICQFRKVSFDGKEWICRNCHICLKRGKLPTQAKCNGLSLCNIPNELKDLNPLEVRLISQRIPFMKLVSLPRGKQVGIQGPAVNVPTDLDVVCEQFPRLPTECQIISLKLKRKLDYRKAYIHDYVRPEKVVKALEWLKQNNPLYKDIDINHTWRHDCENSDSELWHAMTNSRPQNQFEMDYDGDYTERYEMAYQRLKQSARKNGFRVSEVLADGDCQFHAVCHELRKNNIYSGNVQGLRTELAHFMMHNPQCEANGTEYKDFLADIVEQGDLLNADTAQPDERDKMIAEIECLETRKHARWELYLHRLEHERLWGDNITLQGLAERFQVNIHIISSETENLPTHGPISGTSKADVYIGHILQRHYVALDRYCEVTSHQAKHDRSHGKDLRISEASKADSTPMESNDTGQEDSDLVDHDAEDKAALERNAELCGLPYESGLFNKDPDWTNKIISCAPGEKHRPIPLLTDPYFEQLSNPEKFPDGQNGLLSEREKPIQTRRYFNQRLLDVDGRFAKSIDYLLSAQYATESQQIHGNINHYVLRRGKSRRPDGKKICAGDVKHTESLRQLVKSDQAYKIFKNVRGSPAYYQSLFYDILAMMGQLGTPTWFFTLSAADMQWPDLIQTISRQSGVILSDEDVSNLSYAERCNWLRSNPVTAVRHFHYRLETFVKHVLMSNANPLGEIVDYVIRIEFQARGSPHAHTLLWVKNAPQINVQTDDEVCEFVQKYISCSIPDDEDEKELVCKLQRHSHSSYCRKKGSCRFKYPKPPSNRVIIAKEPDSDNSMELKAHARNVMSKVYNAITEQESVGAMSTEELLNFLHVSADEYYKALSVTMRGRKVILARKPCEANINPYNMTCILAWRANMDIQFVEDPHACIMYIAAYISKDEKGMGELLKQVSKECQDLEIKARLRKLGAVFLNNREVSAQEAAMRILSLPMKRLSRNVTFINTDSMENRTAILKPKAVIEAMDNDDEDIFQSNITCRYAVRPVILENLCLASFAANYSVSSTTNKDGDDDHVPDVLENDGEIPDTENMPKKIFLRDGSGTMNRRKREAVIRFRKFNVEKEQEDFCRSKLMLFLPWRDEIRDLLKDYQSYSAHYNDVMNQLKEQESKFTANLALTYHAMEIMDQHGPPEHAWDSIAPENEHNELMDRAERIEEERPMLADDLDANQALFEGPASNENREITSRFDIEAEKNTLTPSEYREMMRHLNNEQRQIIMYNRTWCKNAIKAWKNNQNIEPYRIFLSGPGGVGKSHVIKIIQSDMKKLLLLSHRVKPTDVTVLITAPTGVAAFNVDGMTIHSYLLLRVSGQSTATSLSFDKLNTLRTKLSNLTLMVIDEISMVGSDMLLNIHHRLNEIKGVNGDNVWFGNTCILACGDLYQLPPVRQKCVFNPVKDAMARMHGSGSIFMDEFLLHELTEIMRQKDDLVFAETLGRIRTGEWNRLDIALLKSRELSASDPSYPHDALHIFGFNADVDAHNQKKLNEIANEDEQVRICASDDQYDSTGAIDVSKLPASRSRTQTGGLETVLLLSVNARVMMTVNVDTSDGLVNGVMGEVKAILKNDRGVVHTVLVKFDDIKVGKITKRSSKYKHDYPGCVPVQRHKGQYQKLNKKGAQINRTQFPLTLAWAVTIHKCQGLTLEKVVVDMKGAKRFNNGQAYVAFSRVKSMHGLHILNFDESGIKTHSAVTDAMAELHNKPLPIPPLPEFNNPEFASAITIGHINIHYFLDKQKDLISQFKLYKNIDIMCFTETHLQRQHNIAHYLDTYDYIAYRKDKSNISNQYGIMLCSSSKLSSEPLALTGIQNLEFCAALVTLPSGKVSICTVYARPSLSMTLKLNDLQNIIRQLPKDIPSFIIGDFNHDLAHERNTALLTELENLGFRQYVNVSTTDYGSTLDHIYYNGRVGMQISVLDAYFSDHDLIAITLKQ